MERLSLLHAHIREKADHEKTSEWPYLRPDERATYEHSNFQSSPSPAPSPEPRTAATPRFHTKCIRWVNTVPRPPVVSNGPVEAETSHLDKFLDDFTNSSDAVLALTHGSVHTSRETVTEIDAKKADAKDIVRLVKDQKFTHIIADLPRDFSDAEKARVERLFEEIGQHSDAIKVVCANAAEDIAGVEVIFTDKEVLAHNTIEVAKAYKKKEVHGDKVRYERS